MTTIVLCGGAGTRLWPLSRLAKPKQFCDLLGGDSLFTRTVRRNERHSDRFLIVTNRAQLEIAWEQFEQAQVPAPADFVLEPCGRNTAPAIALACLGLAPEEVVLVVASDHVIKDEAAYGEAVALARAAAAEGYLVTFGLKPAYPETGYGYIEAEAGQGGDFLRVKAFKEKPDAQTAEAYVRAGRYYWNSGMFCFKAGLFLEELGRSSPAILEASRKALNLASSRHEGERGRVVSITEEAMRAIPADSVDYAVMEKSSRVAVVPCSLGWSDLGSWDSIYEAREKDGEENATGPEALALEARGNLVLGSGRKIALIGVEDLIVVDSGDALLVTRRGVSQDVKKIVDSLKSGGETGLL